MQIYQINEEINHLFQQIDDYAAENEGEIDASFVDKLNSLKLQKQEKLEALIQAIKNKNKMIEALEEESRIMRDRANKNKNKVNWLKTYLSSFLEVGEKVETISGSISWRKSKRVVIDDEKLIDDKYCIISREVSKSRIKEALEAGVEVAAHFEEHTSIQIK